MAPFFHTKFLLSSSFGLCGAAAKHDKRASKKIRRIPFSHRSNRIFFNMLLCRWRCTGNSCCFFGFGEASASSLSEWRLKAHFAGYFHKNTESVSLNSVFKGLHIVFLIIWMTKLVSRCLFSGICSATRFFLCHSFLLALFPFYTLEP